MTTDSIRRRSQAGRLSIQTKNTDTPGLRRALFDIVKMLAGLLLLAGALAAQDANAPNYSAIGLVNGASFAPGLAPNTIVSLFGTNLSWSKCSVQARDVGDGIMPTTLCNVRVYFGGWPAYLYYVSPTQINLLIPSDLVAGTFPFWVDRQGTFGPVISVKLDDVAPAMFQTSTGVVIATHLDGSVLTSDAPAAGGEVVTLWATGLGQTIPALRDGGLPSAAQWLMDLDSFNVQLNGKELDSGAVLYAGVAPGYAGLYQVNVRLPDPLPVNPEIRLVLDGTPSPKGRILAAN